MSLICCLEITKSLLLIAWDVDKERQGKESFMLEEDALWSSESTDWFSWSGVGSLLFEEFSSEVESVNWTKH